MSFVGLNGAIRWAAQAAVSHAMSVGLKPTVTSVFRSWEEQGRLRRKWEQGLSRFPANRPGDSAHNYGLAWDSVVEPHQQDEWDAIRRHFGWYIPPNDRIHAEVPNWRLYVSRSQRRS